jgi:hypothetical protein
MAAARGEVIRDIAPREASVALIANSRWQIQDGISNSPWADCKFEMAESRSQIRNGRFKMEEGRRLIANSKWQIQDGRFRLLTDHSPQQKSVVSRNGKRQL